MVSFSAVLERFAAALEPFGVLLDVGAGPLGPDPCGAGAGAVIGVTTTPVTWPFTAFFCCNLIA